MRTWGRITDGNGNRIWVPVFGSPDRDDSYVWITTLIQCLKLNLGESPFYADYGIPAQRSIIQQIIPDFYVNALQTQFARYFANLTITRLPPVDRGNGDVDQNPVYAVNIVTLQGTIFQETVPT